MQAVRYEVSITTESYGAQRSGVLTMRTPNALASLWALAATGGLTGTARVEVFA